MRALHCVEHRYESVSQAAPLPGADLPERGRVLPNAARTTSRSELEIEADALCQR
jgi:hypothetical protein